MCKPYTHTDNLSRQLASSNTQEICWVLSGFPSQWHFMSCSLIALNSQDLCSCVQYRKWRTISNRPQFSLSICRQGRSRQIQLTIFPQIGNLRMTQHFVPSSADAVYCSFLCKRQKPQNGAQQLVGKGVDVTRSCISLQTCLQVCHAHTASSQWDLHCKERLHSQEEEHRAVQHISAAAANSMHVLKCTVDAGPPRHSTSLHYQTQNCSCRELLQGSCLAKGWNE